MTSGGTRFNLPAGVFPDDLLPTTPLTTSGGEPNFGLQDGSVTPVDMYWELTDDRGKEFVLTDLVTQVVRDTMAPDGFGGGAALANGLEFLALTSQGEVSLFVGGIKTNAALAVIGGSNEDWPKNETRDSILGVLAFNRPIRFVQGNRYIVRVNDDLTARFSGGNPGSMFLSVRGYYY